MKDPTILVADEDEDARVILATALGVSGYSYQVAADGATAIGLARTRDVALVVADLYVPCGEGAYLIEALRGDPILRRIPVLAYSGYVFPGDRERAYTLGCAGFIPKPVTPTEVVRAIDRLLAASSKPVVVLQGPVGAPRVAEYG